MIVEMLIIIIMIISLLQIREHKYPTVIFGLIYYKRLDKKFPLLFKLSWGWLRFSLLFIGVFSIGYVVALNAPVLKTWLSFGVYVCLIVSVLLFVSLLFIPALRSYVALIPTQFLFKQKES